MVGFLRAVVFVIAFAVAVFAQKSIIETGTLSIEAQGKSAIEIRTPGNVACDIFLKASSQSGVVVEFEKWSKTVSRADGQRFAELIDVRLDNEARRTDGIRLRVLAPAKAPWEGKEDNPGVSLHISVPMNFAVDSKSSFGLVNLIGPLAEVTIDNEFGRISLDDIDGRVTINSSYSPVKLRRIKGNLNVETSYAGIDGSNIELISSKGYFSTSYGSIDLVDVTGSIEVSTSYSPISVSKIDAKSGSVILRTSYGEIEAHDINGELVCETSYSKITLRGIHLSSGVNMVETKYSPIDMEVASFAEGQLLINNTYGDIGVTLPQELSARVALSVDRGGKIHTRGFPIKPLSLDRNHLEGIIGDGKSFIEATIDGIGEIKLYGR